MSNAPDTAVDIELPASTEDGADLGEGSVFFVGTATVVLRYGGFTVLTDPNFLHAGDHVHLGYGLTAERRTDPALDVEDLPPVDLVLLSHYHGDHFDRIAAAKLDRDLPIVTTHHAARKLAEKGFRETHPLETWEAATIRKGDVDLTVTDPGFDAADHVAAERFLAGEAKEGAGMGGALALADRAGVPAADVRERFLALYDDLVADGGTDP